MLNRTNFVLSEGLDGSSGVTLILYTAHKRGWAELERRDQGSFGLKTVAQFQSTYCWGGRRSKFRSLITNKRRKRSRFLERLITLDQESYERYAWVGARGEPIGN